MHTKLATRIVSGMMVCSGPHLGCCSPLDQGDMEEWGLEPVSKDCPGYNFLVFQVLVSCSIFRVLYPLCLGDGGRAKNGVQTISVLCLNLHIPNLLFPFFLT